MKTKIFYKVLAVLFFVTLTCVSCEKKSDTDDLSFITFYPEFVMEGDEVILISHYGYYLCDWYRSVLFRN